MVEMHLGKSEDQGSTCATVCQNLSSALDGVITSLNEIENYDIKGAAADSAKSFASSVAIPYINQAKNLLNTIKGDVKDLPAKYRSKVDSKSWSTAKLQSLINKCEAQAIAQSTAMGTVGAALAASGSSDAAKVLDKMQSNIDSINKKKKKYKELLKKLNDFNASSPSIFSDIKPLNKALSQGSVAVSGNYSKGSYHKPKDLDWEKVGKGGDKDTYKATTADKTSIKSILVGLIPESKGEKKEKSKIKSKLPKKWNKDWDFKEFERTFFKKAADSEEVTKKIEKWGKGKDILDEKIGNLFAPIKYTNKALDYFKVGTDFEKRIKNGESVTKAIGHTVVSFAGSKIAGAVGEVAGRTGGGAIGMAAGALIGTIVAPGAGSMVGAEIGAEIGSTIGGAVGSTVASDAASKELDKDIN